MYKKSWYVYVVKCSDGSLYCGMTTEVSRRVWEHNNTKKAAKYTRSRRPVKLIFNTSQLTRSEAASIEARFKKLPTQKKQKLLLNESFNDYFDIDDVKHSSQV